MGECFVNCEALHLYEVLSLLFKGSSGKCFSLNFTINPKSLQVNSPSIMVMAFHLRVTTGIRWRPMNRASAPDASILLLKEEKKYTRNRQKAEKGVYNN